VAEESIEERARRLVDPKDFKSHNKYLLAIAAKEFELRQDEEEQDRACRERESARTRRREEIRRRMERGSGGYAVSDKEAEEELEREERELRGYPG
jgi:hypothetical protein